MRIKVLRVEFDEVLMPYEISEFRGAVIEKVGRENIIFNNHLDDTKYRYGYPLVQYKSIRNRPTIMCIEEGVDEIHHFFNQSNWDLKLNDRVLRLTLFNLHLKQFNIQVWENHFTYRLRKWLPLNQRNHDEFRKLEGLSDKISFLEKVLIGNILSFAKGIKWTVEKEIRVKITDLRQVAPIRVKGTMREVFDISFKSNVFLPDYIGLGKNTTLGFGVVKSINTNNNE